ncbi:MAG: HlyD family efflux transporter periplasmic adaptor subunit [Pseudomonadota bacterium]
MAIIDRYNHHFQTLQSIRAPRIMSVIGWMLGVFAFAATAFLAFTPWIQTTAGSGAVTALDPNDRLQEINAFVSGRIEEWYVQDGSMVKQGDPIIRIVDNDPQLLERLEAERAQVIAKQNAAETALQTAQINLERMLDLYEKGLAARREYEETQIRVEDMRARVAEAAAELNRIDINLSRQSAQIARAPRDGMILQVNAGDTATFVSAGDVVARFVPQDVQRAVEIFIDGRDVALVQPGAKARIQFEGWPAVQFSGWPSVAVGTFPGEVVAVDPSADATGRFRILITEVESDEPPWPDERFVRFGSAARAWVLLEEVTVGYELWRQLNNFPPSLPNNQQASSGT